MLISTIHQSYFQQLFHFAAYRNIISVIKPLSLQRQNITTTNALMALGIHEVKNFHHTQQVYHIETLGNQPL